MDYLPDLDSFFENKSSYKVIKKENIIEGEFYIFMPIINMELGDDYRPGTIDFLLTYVNRSKSILINKTPTKPFLFSGKIVEKTKSRFALDNFEYLTDINTVHKVDSFELININPNHYYVFQRKPVSITRLDELSREQYKSFLKKQGLSTKSMAVQRNVPEHVLSVLNNDYRSKNESLQLNLLKRDPELNLKEAKVKRNLSRFLKTNRHMSRKSKPNTRKTKSLGGRKNRRSRKNM
jgi:hypothetical protein